MLIFLASIVGNGALLMLAETPSGSWINDGSNKSITTNQLGHDSLSGFELEENTGFISNTSQSQDASSFNPFVIVGNFVGDIVSTVFAGINALNFLDNGFVCNGINFFKMASWFPIFSPILLGLSALILGAKFC